MLIHAYNQADERMNARLKGATLFLLTGAAFSVTGVLLLVKIYTPSSFTILGLDAWIITAAFTITLASITAIHFSLRSHKHEELPSPVKVQPPIIEVEKPAVAIPDQDLIERIERLEREKEMSRNEPWRQKRGPSGTIGYVLLSFGAVALVLSTLYSLIVLAFIGLGLTFWGALLLFIKPTSYVRASILNPTAISTIIATDQVIAETNHKGKGIYLPPRYFNKPKDGIVFIPLEKVTIIPPAEKVLEERVFIKDPDGMCLTPPGLGLANLFEEELKTDFSKVDLNYLKSNLPKLLTEGLEIAEYFEMTTQNDVIHVKMTGSVYGELCREVRNLQNASSLGCPICSSIACILTRVTGKPITIESNNQSADGKTIETYYRIVED